jgi:hypothetical protein
MTKKRSLDFRHCSLQWSVDNACIVVRDTDNYLMCCSEDYMCVQHDHFFHDFAVWTREALKPCPIDAFIHLAHRNSISIRRESGKKPVNCVSITDTEYTDRRRPRAISKEAVDVVLQQTCMYTSHVTISDSHRRDSHPISPYYSNLIRSIEIQLTVMTTDQVVTAGFPFVERRVILRWQERGSTFVRCLWPVVYRMCPCGCGRGRGAERSVVWPMTISYE